MSFSVLQIDSEAMSVLKMKEGTVPQHNRDITDTAPEHREVRTDKATGQAYLARVRHGRTEWFLLTESPRITTVVTVPDPAPSIGAPLTASGTVDEISRKTEEPVKKPVAPVKKVV